MRRGVCWILTGLVLVTGCGAQQQAGQTEAPSQPEATTAPPQPRTPQQSKPTPPDSPSSRTHAGHAAHAAAPPLPGFVTGNLSFRDQTSNGRRVKGYAEIDGSGGWVVVRADRAGRPGRVLGSSYRANEEHGDLVRVPLTSRVGSGPLWVSLHVDAGKPKRLDFPGPDQPVTFVGHDLAVRVHLSVR